MSLLEIQRSRRTEVLNVTVTELIFILLFVLFVYSEEGDREVHRLEEKLFTTLKENKKLKVINRELTNEARELSSLLSQREREITMLLDNIFPHFNLGGIALSSEEIDRYLNIFIDANNKGTGKRNCLPKNRFLFSVVMHDDGFLVKPIGGVVLKNIRSELPGDIQTLLEMQDVNTADAKKMFAHIFKWSAEQGCRFIVKLHDKTSIKSAFVAQTDLIENYFYRKKTW